MSDASLYFSGCILWQSSSLYRFIIFPSFSSSIASSFRHHLTILLAVSSSCSSLLRCFFFSYAPFISSQTLPFFCSLFFYLCPLRSSLTFSRLFVSYIFGSPLIYFVQSLTPSLFFPHSFPHHRSYSFYLLLLLPYSSPFLFFFLSFPFFSTYSSSPSPIFLASSPLLFLF